MPDISNFSRVEVAQCQKLGIISPILPGSLQLAHQQTTVPNQLDQLTQRPTLRWVFQLLEEIHRVRVTVHGEFHDLIEGLNAVTRQVLHLFGERVCRLYQIAPG